MIAMMIIISHDIIPHYHFDDEDSEMFSDQLSDNNSDDKETDHNHRSQFPPHQHVLSDGDFFVQRSTISLNKVLKETLQDCGLWVSLTIDIKTDLLLNGYLYELKEPLNNKLIILPCNITRGSPCIS